MKKTLKTLLILLFLTLPLQANAAKMALTPASGEFKSGCTNSVNIIVNTEGTNTMAADAFLRYNPEEIDIIDMNPAIPGIQIKHNGIYESYPGNITSNGRIKMTAFNRVGYFNGRGTLGTIFFRSKPGAKEATISFEYAPGRTVDSNIANSEALDILDGAYGGTYKFTSGSCGVDKSPPFIQKKYPATDAILAPADANIEFLIADDGSGVNLDTVHVDLNGTKYSKEGENRFQYEGDENEYRIIIDPSNPFPEKTPVNVKIEAQDFDGNSMKSESYSFNKLIPVELCTGDIAKLPEISCPEAEIKPAAPAETVAHVFSKTGRQILLILLFFLLLSLATNIWLFTEPCEVPKKAVKKRKTVRKRKK